MSLCFVLPGSAEALITSSAPGGGVRSIVMSMSVCLSVCLSIRISGKPHCRDSPNFVHVARGCGSGGDAIHCILPVSWITSCFHIMDFMERHVQRMDSSAACVTSCAMPTVDESNHSSAGMLHSHRSATFYLNRPTLRCPIPPKRNLPLPVGDFNLYWKKSHSSPFDPRPKWRN